MPYLLLLLAFFTFLFLLIRSSKKKQVEKSLKQVRRIWKDGNTSLRNFELIALYHKVVEEEECFQQISVKTWADLNMNEVFSELDRTTSKVGQQYLFHLLQRPKNKQKELQAFDELIEYVAKENETRESVQLQLLQLNNFGAYYAHKLLFEEVPEKPKWYFLVPIFLFLNIVFTFTIYFYPPIFIGLLIISAFNLVFYFWNKNQVYYYRQSLQNILPLITITEQLEQLKLLNPLAIKLKEILKKTESIKSQIKYFSAEKVLEGDVTMILWNLIELLKMIYPFEVILFRKMIKKIDEHDEELHLLFKYIGTLDAAISIASIRKGLPYFCKPIFESDEKLVVKKIYHPLIENCIPNDLSIEEKSILLTGSNMSGKTTFIRTVAINTLLAQTIYTCFAEQYKSPFYQLYSSIQIEDSIEKGNSYYFEEVQSIGSLLEKSKTGASCLFVIDEVFKGTNTVERVSAAKAVLSFLAKGKHLVFVSTHDIELTEFLQSEYELFHFTEIVDEEDELFFDHKLKKGKLTTRNAIRILEINHYPKTVILEAKEIAKKMDKQK